MDALFRFYCASLSALYRDRLFRDFVHFVAAEAADNTPGVEVREKREGGGEEMYKSMLFYFCT